MESVERNGTFEDAIRRAAPDIAELARALRDLITAVDPDVVEVPWPRQGVVGYGIGEKKMSEHYAWIGTASTHAQLGFNRGAELDDQEDLLEGTGALLRHVKVRTRDDVERSALRRLLEQARRHQLSLAGR